MQSAVLEKPVASGALDADRVRALVLVRIACAAQGLSRTALAADLAPFTAHRMPLAHWRALVERESEALREAGLARLFGTRLKASEAGVARVAIFLGFKGALPGSWEEVHEVRLTAKALGLERDSGRRLAALATPMGLRAAIVQRAFGLKIKGVATPSRLRTALAAVALERAFGNQIKSGLSNKLGLSPKAGRLLAGQLAKRPRDFGTDARLIAALAAEHVGAAQADVATLRLALLRSYLDGPGKPPARPRPPVRAPARPHLVAAAPAPVASLRPDLVGPDSARPDLVRPDLIRPDLVRPDLIRPDLVRPDLVRPDLVRPDLASFAREVRQLAEARAQGWPGNRRAYISQVWQLVRERRCEWGLSEIEFKCMLIEAHRAGSLALAHADMKDSSNVAELQDSAVVYKNAVFHFVRVDG